MPKDAAEHAHMRERLAVLSALATATDNRRELLEIITDAATTENAMAQLGARFGFSATEARAVLDMQILRFIPEEAAKVTTDVATLKSELDHLDGQ